MQKRRSCSPEEDGLRGQPVSVLCMRLENSTFLDDIEKHLCYLSRPEVIGHLIRCHAPLFGNKPTQTTVLAHDIDVGGHKPIKQHAYCVNPVKRAAM